MKKFNLIKEIIAVDKKALLSAINSTKIFAITIEAEVIYEPFAENAILIYEGQNTPQKMNALMPSKPKSLTEILGKNYQVVEDDERVLIKAYANWQELIKVNTPRASYDDTTGDGVDRFASDSLEELGWQATEFDINYRTLVEVLEAECDGTLLCIEREDPYQFSGLGYLSNNQQAYEVLYEYCKVKIKQMIENDPAYKVDNLSDDEVEAVEYFKCL